MPMKDVSRLENAMDVKFCITCGELITPDKCFSDKTFNDLKNQDIVLAHGPFLSFEGNIFLSSYSWDIPKNCHLASESE